MLSASDTDLIQRDPALPGLSTLLDNDALADRLRPFLPDTGTVQSTYVRYKPGTSCLVAYRLKVAGTEIEFYATAYRPDARDKLQKARRLPCVPGLTGPGRIFLDDCAVVVSIFPNDSRLKILPCLTDTQARRRLLYKLFPHCPDLWEGTVETLRYKPGRRYVARLMTGDDARAVLKIYTSNGYQAANSNSKAFRSRWPLRIAQRVSRSNRHHIMAFEWIHGYLISDAIFNTDQAYEGVVTTGAALAELHAQNPGGLVCLERRTEAAILLEVAAWIGFVCPHLAEQARDLAQRLAARLMHEPPVNRSIHGDFYAKQVLIQDDTAAILDLDKAVRGDPAADLGNFIAHLERDALCGNISVHRVEMLKKALLEGYGAATCKPVPASVELYTAAGLLHLAPEPFRIRQPDWPQRTETILKQIEAIVK